MEGEKIWKGLYERFQTLKSNPFTEHHSRLQDADGGFFEKFGSLLHQKSCIEEETLQTKNLKNANDEGVEDGDDDDDGDNDKENKDDDDNGGDDSEANTAMVNDMTLNENVIVNEKKKDFIEKSSGMNIEGLYEEILYEIQNNIGCNANEICEESLVDFVQEVFKIPNAKHMEIMAAVATKEPPNVRLNIEIIKCENLMSKDSNGLSDPFVTLYLETNNSIRYNSSVKTETLNPIWEESFSLPINGNPNSEILIIEVWDFDAAETVKEKVNKILDVKGIKGLRKLMKEIALTASTGKHDNELIGRVTVSLKSIPVSGVTSWYNLEKDHKTKRRGSILISLSLSAEKNKQVAIQEHRHLLKLLLMHELEASQVTKYWWNGKFSTNAEIIQAQHATQSGLNNFECSLSQWCVYTAIHEEHPLSFTLFNSLLNVVIPILKNHLNENDDIKAFWMGVRRILPTCLLVLRKLRSKSVSDKQIVKALCEVLIIFSKLNTMPYSRITDVLPIRTYKMANNANVGNENESKCCTLNDAIIDAIYSGTQEWLEQIIDINQAALEKERSGCDDAVKDKIENELADVDHVSSKNDDGDSDELQYLIKLIQMVRSDLQRAMEYFDIHFYHKVHLNFSSILFKFYDEKLAEIIKPVVVNTCNHIKRLDVPDNEFDNLPNINNTFMGTTLFELYLVIKRFLVLGESLCENDKLDLQNFHIWFMPGVTHWLDISVIKALNRIEKALELDQLIAVDDSVKYSSSAVDTLAIFYQIKIFWQQLNWPDIEGSYTFVAKIVDDICRCCIFYAQRMSRRVANHTKQYDELFHVTPEWCFAINNIDYIRQTLPSFIKELDINGIIKQLAELRTNLEAERCELTIKNVVENSLDTQRNQIIELVEIVAAKMAPPIKRFLAEGAEVLHKDSNSMERLMMYLESSLETLHNNLNDVNFARILDAIWNELATIMYNLIQTNLDKYRPPLFFKNLRDTLDVMIASFKIGNIATSEVESLTEIIKILDLHALETADLIHQYYLDKFLQQNNSSSSKPEYGQLTIRANLTNSNLMLEIMNARNLVPMDSNGNCDPFVKVHFLPTVLFAGLPILKTAVQYKTLYPLYDEQFTICLNEEQLAKQNAILIFSIKDKDLFGMTNQNIAECYITLSELLNSANEQIHLNLCKPQFTDTEITRTLAYRQGDKQAREFLKKLKNKSFY